MKKEILLGAVAAVVLVGCSNNDNVKNIEEKEFVLGFSGAYVDKTTKAITPGLYTVDNFETVGNTMGVYGYKVVTKGYASAQETEVFGNQEVEYKAVSGGNDWVYSPLKYWDKNADKYCFYAYAPHSSDFTGTVALSGNTENGFSITGFKQSTTVADQIDLLTDLTTQKVRTNYTNDVEFTFNHILANVNVLVKISTDLVNDATDNPVTVTDVKLSSIKLDGDYSYQTDAYKWTVSATSTTSDFTNTSGMASSSLSNTAAGVPGLTNMLFVPQELIDDYVVEITYKIGEQEYKKSAKLSEFSKDADGATYSSEWKAGYKYNYVLFINPLAILFDITATGVAGWTEETYVYTIE